MEGMSPDRCSVSVGGMGACLPAGPTKERASCLLPTQKVILILWFSFLEIISTSKQNSIKFLDSDIT